jgi:hypothetical protein
MERSPSVTHRQPVKFAAASGCPGIHATSILQHTSGWYPPTLVHRFANNYTKSLVCVIGLVICRTLY